MLYRAPSSELKSIATMSREQKLHYAAARMLECEEVWSIGDESGWEIHGHDEQPYIMIWPYKQFAEHYCEEVKTESCPLATSIDQLVYSVLQNCLAQKIEINVMPQADSPGCRISASDLYQLLNGMLETGEYVIEG